MMTKPAEVNAIISKLKDKVQAGVNVNKFIREHKSDVRCIRNFRNQYLQTMLLFKKELLSKINLDNAIIGGRLKKLPTLLNKVVIRLTKLDIDILDDIIGYRIVFENYDTLLAFTHKLSN